MTKSPRIGLAAKAKSLRGKLEGARLLSSLLTAGASVATTLAVLGQHLSGPKLPPTKGD